MLVHLQTIDILNFTSVPRETAACAHSVVPTEMMVGDCVSAAKVNMTQCVGTCGSNATTVFMEPFVETNCMCCKPTSMTKQTVDLQCGTFFYPHWSQKLAWQKSANLQSFN